jgi:uncharacterized membrane protein
VVSGVLALVGLVCTGTAAGVFVAVALSVIPALAALPMPQYAEMHRRLGKGYHPVMPIVVLVALLAEGGLAATATSGAARAAAATTAVLLMGVQAVSHFGNERLNRAVRELAAGRGVNDWRDTRPLWRRWHLIRTVSALLAFTSAAVGSMLL